MSAVSDMFTMSQDRLNLMKRTIAKGATDDEFALFVATAQRMGLDPFARQIIFTKRKRSFRREDKTWGWEEVATILVSIDGFRLVAQRTQKYRGQTPVNWCGPDGVWRDVWLDREPPAAARVGVYHADFVEPLVVVARYQSYAAVDKEGHPLANWATMPELMLAKCAEALALRKAFPHELSGVYTQEEMEQAGVPQTQNDDPMRRMTDEEFAVIIETATANGWTEDEVRTYFRECGVAKRSELKLGLYEPALSHFSGRKENAAPPVAPLEGGARHE